MTSSKVAFVAVLDHYSVKNSVITHSYFPFGNLVCFCMPLHVLDVSKQTFWLKQVQDMSLYHSLISFFKMY